MAGSAIPMPGALYSSPPIPADFGGLGIPSGILATCHVTTGPDRNLYWVYDDMKSSDTAIQAPVPRGTCFETRDSIAVSQHINDLSQLCSTCNRRLQTHMTAAQASAAFAAHAVGFPATHVQVIVPPAPVLSHHLVLLLLLVLLHQFLLLAQPQLLQPPLLSLPILHHNLRVVKITRYWLIWLIIVLNGHLKQLHMNSWQN